MSERYKRNAGCVYNVKYHIVWCPKYRKEVLFGAIANRLKELLYEEAKALKIEIEAIEVMPDHVHILVEVDPQFLRFSDEVGVEFHGRLTAKFEFDGLLDELFYFYA